MIALEKVASFFILSVFVASGRDVGLSESPLLIGSFNVRSLGPTKLDRPHVVDLLVQIIRRYDIILIMEIRDITSQTMSKLLNEINKNAQERYDLCLSNRVGRGTYKEQLSYIYKTSKVSLIRALEYDDKDDKFEREPYIAQFRLSTASIDDLTIIGAHIKPASVQSEMDAIPEVVQDVKRMWGVENILIAGDLNCHCDYIRPENFINLLLVQDKSYHWLIDKCAGRTMISTWCQYDRMVATGDNFVARGVVPGSGTVFKFDKVFGLDESEALQVSDHRPVEIQIFGKVNRVLLNKLKSEFTFSVLQPIPAENQVNVRSIYRVKDDPDKTGSFDVLLLTNGYRYHMVEAKTVTTNLDASLDEFVRLFPNVIIGGTITTVLAHSSAINRPPDVPVLGPVSCPRNDCNKTVLSITCTLQDPWTCTVSATMSIIASD